MDVIFPASPALLYAAPEILKRLLLPILHFADNQTDIPYWEPFCPHQLGFYPIANSTTALQEQMPLEETGNMFLMIEGYLQATNRSDLFFEPWYPMLKAWAWWMAETQLPNPPYQLSTDDFTGPMSGNLNLAAKGIISLHAFAQICKAMGDTECDQFEVLAASYAVEWKIIATTSSPPNSSSTVNLTHTRMAVQRISNITDSSWGTKYNLVWQKMLRFGDKPFSNFNELRFTEVTWYQSQMQEYGYVLDSRFNFQKVDWMTWGNSLTNSTDVFVEMFDKLYNMFNETTTRIPMTDLFLVANGQAYIGFRSRAVVGALFAPAVIGDL